MFLSKISASIRLNNVVARTCQNNNKCIHRLEQLRYLCITSEKKCESLNQQLSNITFLLPACRFSTIRNFSSEPLPANSEIFGDIGTRKYDKVQMDEIEQKVEEFDENEAKIPRRKKLSPGQYADLIKTHVENGDLSSAEGVLQIAKNNRDKPTLYMYTLILRAYAHHGDVKKVFKLYNRLLKQGLKPNEATITSLFNVCSNSLDDISSLEYLHNLRSDLYKKDYKLNATHYNTLIKAYARHRQINQAFQLLDEMKDKKLPIDETTFNNLLHGASCLKNTGIKYALVVWHLMKVRKVKPSLTTYNLMFRVIRDTNIGDLKVNDILIANTENSQILITEGGRPDLLASPPVIRSVPLITQNKWLENEDDKNTNRREETSLCEQVSSEGDFYPKLPLSEIIKRNRLILFGGFDGIVKRMEDEGIVPDKKSMTLLLELIPNTKEAEKYLITYTHKAKIQVDIDFYNVLIKRRCFRHQYADAKAVLADIEKEGLQPDIFTWSSIALSCATPEESRNLLNCLDEIGLCPNYFIYGALFRTAIIKLEFDYINELMDSMIKKRVVPSNTLYNMLDNFKATAADALKEKKSLIQDRTKFHIALTKFKVKYASFQKVMKRDKVIYRSSQD